MSNPKIEAGLELIAALGTKEIKIIDIRDLLFKLITKNYDTIDEILKVAVEKGLLKRLKKLYLRTPGEATLQYDKPKIITLHESGHCKLCGKSVSTQYFVVFKKRQYGAFGSSCVKRIHLEYLL